jgi:formate dehydrogenase subunit gamma
MARTILRFAGALLLTAGLCVGAHAQTPRMGPDQSPATNAIDADFAKQQQQRQVTQPLNNQPVWSEVRSGSPQFTSLPGRETNVLIQPEGQTWRALRNSQVSVYAGWALVAMVIVIAAFYFWKGTMQLHEPPTGRRIRRFTNWQMAIHWTTAYAFITLAITGLIIVFGKNVLLPLIGYTLFSWLAILAKNLHNFVGPLFFICILLLFSRSCATISGAVTTGHGSAISAVSCPATTCRRASSTPARRSGSGAACWHSD